MKAVLPFFALMLLASCYTQLLTSADLAAPPQSEDTASTQAPPSAPATPSSASIDCNCSAWEIQNDLCWCTCDRCGYYHRVGYRNCPGGIYRSYWGWDYYNDYPWWSDRYRGRYNIHGGYYDRYHDHRSYGGTAPSAGSRTVPTELRRQKDRGVINDPPDAGSTLSRPQSESESSYTPSVPAPSGSSGNSTSVTIQPPAPAAPAEGTKPVEVKTQERGAKKKRGEIE